MRSERRSAPSNRIKNCGVFPKSATSTRTSRYIVWQIRFLNPFAACVAVSCANGLPPYGPLIVIAKSDLIILLVSSSLLGVAIYRWDQNTRNVNTSTVLANTQATAPSTTEPLDTTTSLTPTVVEPLPTVETTELPVAETVPVESTVETARPFLTHIVQSGDSLSEIASEYNTTVRELRDLNGISGSTIFIGQEILYPAN